MRNISKHALGPLCGLLILFSTISILTPVKRAWLRYTGAVMPNGSRTDSFTDRGVLILSAPGERWVTWDRKEDASAYYALVILPSADVENYGYVSGGDGFTHTDIERWIARNYRAGSYQVEERELKIEYDAMWQNISVDSRTYSLSRGNLFVIRYDADLQPAVTQFGVTINRVASHEDIINAFKSVLPGDRLVQQLP